MPSAKMWPEPLPSQTTVKIRENASYRFGQIGGSTGFVESYEEWKPGRFIYRVDLRDGEQPVSIPAKYIQPLDMSDPDDVEAWLDE